MSETKENCPECGHTAESHWRDKYLTAKPYCVSLKNNDPRQGDCPCTRSYESLVGERQEREQRKHEDKMKQMVEMQSADLRNCPCRSWAWRNEYLALDVWHHPNCDGKGGHKELSEAEYKAIRDAKPEPTLSLLIIVLAQDQCVVKEEKGQLPNLPESIGVITHGDSHTGDTFLVSADFPELRAAIDGEKPLPRIEARKTEGLYRLMTGDREIDTFLSQESIDALSTLAGKPLPIYNGGTWKQLNECETGGLDVWRYSR